MAAIHRSNISEKQVHIKRIQKFDEALTDPKALDCLSWFSLINSGSINRTNTRRMKRGYFMLEGWWGWIIWCLYVIWTWRGRNRFDRSLGSYRRRRSWSSWLDWPLSRGCSHRWRCIWGRRGIWGRGRGRVRVCRWWGVDVLWTKLWRTFLQRWILHLSSILGSFLHNSTLTGYAISMPMFEVPDRVSSDLPAISQSQNEGEVVID